MNEVNDPKGAAGALKAPLGLIPSIAMEHTSWVHLLGSKKYGPFNWRKTGVCATTYVNAILRHLNAWREGEDNDAESGITHLAHIACCCNILMDAQRCGTLQDDRNVLPAPKQGDGLLHALRANSHLMPDMVGPPLSFEFPKYGNGPVESANYTLDPKRVRRKVPDETEVLDESLLLGHP